MGGGLGALDGSVPGAPSNDELDATENTHPAQGSPDAQGAPYGDKPNMTDNIYFRKRPHWPGNVTDSHHSVEITLERGGRQEVRLRGREHRAKEEV
jgi:hypothetical protein